MARDQALISCPVGEWTELTNADVTNISFQVQDGAVRIRVTTGSAPAAITDAGYLYYSRAADPVGTAGELNVAVSSLSAAAGADRVFAIPLGRAAKVLVDHA